MDMNALGRLFVASEPVWIARPAPAIKTMHTLSPAQPGPVTIKLI